MLSHLLEIRQRALIVLLVFAVFFILFFFMAGSLFHSLVKPLISALPYGDSLIATQITSSVLTPISLAANVAILCTTPVALFHLWRFTAPGLYHHERSKLRGVIGMSLLLFGLGVAFCFHLVLPFMFQFFAKALPPGVKMMPDMANALDFITRMLLLFGFCFQVPLICLTFVRLGWIDVIFLRQIRPYIIVAAFTLGMLLTPPDVLSQIMLALPLCLLYEFGILLAVWKGPEKVPAEKRLSSRFN
jgi:sec-independent protein translocase protein TatC